MPASSSAWTISSQACSAPAASGSTSASDGQVARPSPSRIPGRTPAASAAAVTGPSSGSPCGSGASAAGRSASVGVRRSAALRPRPGAAATRRAATGAAPAVRWVALLRAVNLGARNKVPMAQLRTLLEDAGYGDVRTYIASGNVLLDGPAARKSLGRDLERLVEDAFGVTTAVILRKPRELAAIV